MKWFVRLFIGAGLVIFGGGSLFALYAEFGLPWKHAEMKKEMTAYSEERYYDDFELDGIRFDFLHGASYYTEATAATTDVRFYVERANDGTFEDSYGYEYWSRYGEETIKPYIPFASSILTEVTLAQPLVKEQDISAQLETACWTVYADVPYELTAETNDNELGKLLGSIQQMTRDDICLQYVSVGYMGEYVELTEEQLQHIDDVQQLTVVSYEALQHPH